MISAAASSPIASGRLGSGHRKFAEVELAGVDVDARAALRGGAGLCTCGRPRWHSAFSIDPTAFAF